VIRLLIVVYVSALQDFLGDKPMVSHPDRVLLSVFLSAVSCDSHCNWDSDEAKITTYSVVVNYAPTMNCHMSRCQEYNSYGDRACPHAAYILGGETVSKYRYCQEVMDAAEKK
jgi:hypothetical protein